MYNTNIIDKNWIEMEDVKNIHSVFDKYKII